MPRSIDDDRYLTERRNKNGTLRYYWQPPGQKPVRLPDGPGMKMTLTQLNQQRDATRADSVTIVGTVSWVIDKYRGSNRFEKLSDSSKRIYSPWLSEIKKLWGLLPVSAIDKQVCFKFVDRYKDRPSTQNHAAVVLYNVLAEGQRHGLVPSANPASKLGLSPKIPRDAIWSAEDRAAWLEAAKRHPRHAKGLALYFILLEYTAQRPGDVRALVWTGYDDIKRKIGYDSEWIRLVQEKTGKYVEIPVHHELRRVLDEHNTSVVHIGGHIVTRPDGLPYNHITMQELFREVSRTAGITNLQARDLRRTACVRLAEAGCTDLEIAAISGHSIDRTRLILETYVPRTKAMGAAAMAKWERNEIKKV